MAFVVVGFVSIDLLMSKELKLYANFIITFRHFTHKLANSMANISKILYFNLRVKF